MVHFEAKAKPTTMDPVSTSYLLQIEAEVVQEKRKHEEAVAIDKQSDELFKRMMKLGT
jgi:hypothetical protein